MLPTGDNTNKILIIATLLISSVLVFSVPLWEPDLWWHLATGKYIVEHRGLPLTDPFSYTSSPAIPSIRETVLKGYWISQIIFYGVHAIFGNYGVIALRTLLLFSILLILYLWGIKKRTENISLFVVLILAGWVSTCYTGERPQLFSFLFAVLLLYLLEDIRKVPYTLHPTRYILLPLIMLFWANMHGGFVMGTAVLMIYLVSEGVKKLFNKSLMEGRAFYTFCIVIGIAILASLLNPNTYKTYILAFESQREGIFQQMISEYISQVEFLSHGRFFAPYWIYFLISIISFGLSFKKVDFTHVVLFIFLAAISLSTFRYIPFFIYLTAPLTANYLSGLIKESERLLKIRKLIVAVLILGVFVVSILRGVPNVNAIMKHPVKGHWFPEGATLFIKNTGPEGNLFNHYNWGGYLTWRLYPHHRVFIDGRALNLKALSDYTYMLWDTPERGALFESYKVKMIIIPGLSPSTGQMYELVDILIRDDEWFLVFVDDDALVFLRGKENEELIKRYAMPKIEAYSQVISQGINLIESGLNNYHVWRALERAYTGKGFLYQAWIAHEKALGLMREK